MAFGSNAHTLRTSLIHASSTSCAPAIVKSWSAEAPLPDHRDNAVRTGTTRRMEEEGNARPNQEPHGRNDGESRSKRSRNIVSTRIPATSQVSTCDRGRGSCTGRRSGIAPWRDVGEDGVRKGARLAVGGDGAVGVAGQECSIELQSW
jgi:hypothetical protein